MTDTSKKNHFASLSLNATAQLNFRHSSFPPGNQTFTAFLCTPNSKPKAELDGLFLDTHTMLFYPANTFPLRNFTFIPVTDFWKLHLKRNT